MLAAWMVLGLVILADWALVSAAVRPALQEPARTTLGSVHEDPQGFVGQRARVHVQLCDELAWWNPYLTRFGSAEWSAWRVWSDEQFLWSSDDWQAPQGVLFARRGSVAEQELRRAGRFTRFEVLVSVDQVFLGRPWLAIEELRAAGDTIGEGSILHATRALELMEAGAWQMARENLERAQLGPMPPSARDELRRLLQQCDAARTRQ